MLLTFLFPLQSESIYDLYLHDCCFIMKDVDLPQKMEECRLCSGLLKAVLPQTTITIGFNM